MASSSETNVKTQDSDSALNPVERVADLPRIARASARRSGGLAGPQARRQSRRCVAQRPGRVDPARGDSRSSGRIRRIRPAPELPFLLLVVSPWVPFLGTPPLLLQNA